MFEMEEIKDAVETIGDVTKISIDGKTISFYYGDSFTLLKIAEKDLMTSSKMEVTNTFKSPIDLAQADKSGEAVAEHVNLITDTPCKVVFVNIKNSNGAFIVRNIFTDKLDDFSEDNKGTKLRKSNLKILILAMMLENYACYKELAKEMEKGFGEALK